MNGQANGHVRDRSQQKYGNSKAEEKKGVDSVNNEDNQLKEWIRARRLGMIWPHFKKAALQKGRRSKRPHYPIVLLLIPNPT